MSGKCVIEVVRDSSAAKKFCKTLDNLSMDDNNGYDNNVKINNGSDNLYLAVRQCLRKVHRLSRSTMSPLKSPRPVLSSEKGSGVSGESSIGKFYAIKAFFDRNAQKIKNAGSRRNETITDRLVSAVGTNDRGSWSDK